MVKTFCEYPPSVYRSPVIAKQMVATSQPLAAQAGLKILLEGGNAVDAAIATASALTVVEPTMNGIGSDAFAIVYKDGNLFGLNASGKSPATWTPKRFSKCLQMPTEGWESVTVPGAVSGWVALSKRFGKLPFKQVLRPAIEFAIEGFHVSPIVAYQWELQSSR
ncbi:MAG: gamma-glutamyltransferase, partial [Proteobacteria bacterium]|nr:gamma-glutamyltransferase [Pseudomonadota bacterium]